MSDLAFGVVGLGRIGGGLARQAVARGIRVVGVDEADVEPALTEAGVIDGGSMAGLRERLSAPRVVFVYVPAGPAVDGVLDELAETLEQGDVIVDGGNSYWGDSIRRERELAERGLGFVDAGTSGGVAGAREGACFMVGGEPDVVARAAPIFEALAVEGGYVHAGPPGAGHYVKLVHNGIEFGMLQAIAEGVSLLEPHRGAIDVAAVLGSWRHGSVIRGWLVDLMEQEYRHKGSLDAVPAYVEDTGEVNWLVSDAMQQEVPVPVIAQSVMQLFASRERAASWARAIAMMRHGFGGHPYGEDEGIQRERRESRVGAIHPHARPWASGTAPGGAGERQAGGGSRGS